MSRAELKTRRYFSCPNGCDHELSVEHLFHGVLAVTAEYPRRTAGPWYCDVCGQGWRLSYDHESIDVEPYDGGAGNRGFGRDGKRRWQWVVLELPPQREPVRFKVRGMRFSPEINEENVRYYYEEHTCPVNWLAEVNEVRIGEDADPHGLWRVVEVSDLTDEEKADV